jgi:hypothetical protein
MAANTVIREQSGRVFTIRLHNPSHNSMTGATATAERWLKGTAVDLVGE